MKRYEVEYSSNNSGGGWWLDDDAWKNLEKSGWRLDEYKEGDLLVVNGRFLGALHTSATIIVETDGDEFDAERIAIRNFEEATGEDAEAEGCVCCGRPHSFWTRELK